MEKLNETQQTLRQIKNGKTLFDLDMMQQRYSNPFLKDPKTRQQLQAYIEQQQPRTHANPVINFIEESKQPLLSQEVKEVSIGDTKILTTGKSWLPTGDTLISFSDTINKGIKA